MIAGHRLTALQELSTRALAFMLTTTVLILSATGLTGFTGPASSAPPEPPRAVNAPSVVSIERVPGGYRYLVNGQPEFIRGMGYNVMDRGETPAQTEARYRRDLQMMRKLGVNTINGWDQERFNETLLRIAEDEGIGVIMHFELPPALDYGDPAVQAEYFGRIVRWVLRYQNFPAVRMWAIGNEVFHGMPEDPQYLRPAAFAAFLVKAMDIAHTVDPNHPVIYREAETLYVPYLQRALAENPADRPWLVYGMNYFTPGLQQALDNWAIDGLGTPVVVTEFGPWPFGLSTAERSAGYVNLWNIIRSHRVFVLGGLAYVWYQRGPELTDVSWGLVNDDNVPVGNILGNLSAAYRQNELAGLIRIHGLEIIP